MLSASERKDKTDRPAVLVRLFNTDLRTEKQDLCDWLSDGKQTSTLWFLSLVLKLIRGLDVVVENDSYTHFSCFSFKLHLNMNILENKNAYCCL